VAASAACGLNCLLRLRLHALAAEYRCGLSIRTAGEDEKRLARQQGFELERYVQRRHLPAIYDLATTWYQGWYFELRLEEELWRGERYAFPVSVVSIRLLDDLGSALLPQRQEFNNRLASIAATRLRRSDIPGILDERHFAICLPHTEIERARVVVERIKTALRGYRISVGVAGSSGGGRDARGLVAEAVDNSA
jgi:GGDEF domain-containing protein